MSYELGNRTTNRGSGVARNGKAYAVNTRGAGTSSSARARRVASGVSGYGNLAGYQDGLGFSLTSLIAPIASFIPGGSLIVGGAQAVQSATAPGAVSYTAPWQVGLPGPGDVKDQTRIAYAKRDHDLAVNGDATAYANLKSQAVGSATAVGKAWYNAALNDVNRIRAGGTVTPTAMTTTSPTTTTPPAPNFDVGPPRLVTADMAGIAGMNPLLLGGVVVAAILALRGRR